MKYKIKKYLHDLTGCTVFIFALILCLLCTETFNPECYRPKLIDCIGLGIFSFIVSNTYLISEFFRKKFKNKTEIWIKKISEKRLKKKNKENKL